MSRFPHASECLGVASSGISLGILLNLISETLFLLYVFSSVFKLNYGTYKKTIMGISGPLDDVVLLRQSGDYAISDARYCRTDN